MTSRDQKLTIFSEKVPLLHIITWFNYGLLSTKTTEIIENFLFLGFIWHREFHQVVSPKMYDLPKVYPQNWPKCVKRVQTNKLGGHSLSRSAVV